MKTELRSANIVLTTSTQADAAEIYHLRIHPVVNAYIRRNTTQTPEAVEKLIAGILADPSKARFFTIRTVADQQFVGTICLWRMDLLNRFAEIGYQMLPEFEGKGIMSAAMKLILDFGFTDLHLNHIEAYTHRDNERSRKLLERAGFRLVEHKTDPDVPTNVIYALKK